MPSWGTAQFITALLSTALYSTKNLITRRAFVSVVASGPGVCARQLGRNCSEQQNWGLNVMHWGRASAVPAERNPDWNPPELSAGTSERVGPHRCRLIALANGIWWRPWEDCQRKSAAHMAVFPLPPPPSKQQQEAGRRWLGGVCGGGHWWSQKPGRAKPITRLRCPRGEGRLNP